VNSSALERRNSRIAFALFLVGIAAAVPGLLRLEVERDATLAFIPGTGALSENYARYLDLFPGDIGTMVVATGELCTQQRWRALIDLAEDLAALPVVDKVTGLPTVEYVVGSGDVVEVADFIDLRPERAGALCELARSYRPYRTLLVTDDLRAMALYVRAFKELDDVTIDDAIAPVVERHRPNFLDGAGGDLFQAGSAYMSSETSRLTARSPLLVAVSAAIMFLASWIVTGRLRVGILAIQCGIVGVLATLALMGVLGIEVDPMNALLTQAFMPLGAAFTIHAWGYAASSGPWKWGLLPENAIRPFVFAVVTTAVGFGATAISTIPNVHRFGLLGMFGIAVCGLTTVAVTFPALASQRHPGDAEEARDLPSLLERPLRMSRRTAVLLAVALSLISLAGWLRVRVHYSPLDYIPRDNPVRVDMDRGAEFFNRINAQLVISTHARDGALDPDLWRRVRGFARDMERKYPGMRVSWIYDQLAELSLAFTAEQAEPVALPASRDLMAQYLLLLDPREVEPFLDTDRSTLTIVFRVPWRSSTGFRPFKQDVRAFAERAGIDANVTGKVATFYEVIDRMAVENVESLAIGLVLVLLLLWSFSGAASVALIGTLVNAIPVLGSLAFLGFTGLGLDLGSSVVSAIALGVVVDDTGHLIARYEGCRRAGSAPEAAARRMLAELWKPVLTTSLVIVIGFSVMNLAELVPFHTFSRTLSIAVICAVFGDLVLLPALLIHFDRRRR
jgi:predicted RND superfamily exporter protein